MFFVRALALTASLAMAATPCLAADPTSFEMPGERRSNASAGAYFAIPFGGQRNGRAQAGLRLRMAHDYRDAGGRLTRSIGSDAVELRLIGERQPTLFVAEMPVTGRENRQNLMGGGPLGIAVIALAVVGAYVIYQELDDDETDMPN